MADNSAAAGDDAPITFNVKSSSDTKYTLTMSSAATVAELKEKLSGKEFADLSVDRQRLVYSGRVLKDPDTLSSYKIKEGHTIHLVKGAASNQRQNPSSSGQGSTPVPSMPTNLSAGTGNNPLAGLTGARYAGFAQLPSQDMFGPDGGMGPPPDPEDMIRMLQNPQFASTLNEALANPQLIDTMIQQNPLLRGMGPQVRQMMQTPEFRRMMTDPEQLRSMMQMQRMFGGGSTGLGGGGGNAAFPMPGVTDTTPGGDQAGQHGAQQGQQRQPPPVFNPYAMLGQGFGGQQGQTQGQNQAANPFAALLNPGLFGAPAAQNPATATPSTGQTNTSTATPASGAQQPSSDSTTSQTQSTQQQTSQQPQNPFSNLGSNPFMQNPQLLSQFLSAMNSSQPPASTNPSDPASQQQQQAAANPLAALFNNPAMNPFMGGAGADAFGGAGSLGAFGNAFGGAGAGMGAGQQAPADTRPPEERYAEQLRQLNDMGFYEFERNVEALRRTGGSVQGAVEYLLTR